MISAPLQSLYFSQRRILCGLVAICGLGAGTVQADSVWDHRDPNRAYLVRDSLARQVGDIVTIVISESTNVQNKEDKGLSKSNSANGKFGLDTSTGGGLGISAATGAFDLANSSDRSFTGGATYKDSRLFSDRVSVTVVDVLPNGNLVLSGERCLTIDGDVLVLKVSGVVRANDVSPDNSVASRHVANLSTLLEDRGSKRPFIRQGWFGRTMNRVWPH